MYSQKFWMKKYFVVSVNRDQLEVSDTGVEKHYFPFFQKLNFVTYGCQILMRRVAKNAQKLEFSLKKSILFLSIL